MTVTSSWTSNDTRDGNASSFSRHLTIANCPVIVPSAARAAAARDPRPAHAVDHGVGRCGTRWVDPRHGHAEWRVVADGHDHVRALRGERHHVLDGAVHRHRGGQRRRQLRLAGGHARGMRAPTSGSRPTAATLANHERRDRVQRPGRAGDRRHAARPGVLRAVAGGPARSRRQGAQSLSVHVTALGVKSVTFYLDGRKLKTVTKAKNQRYCDQGQRARARLRTPSAAGEGDDAQRDVRHRRGREQRSSRSSRPSSGGRSSPASRNKVRARGGHPCRALARARHRHWRPGLRAGRRCRGCCKRPREVTGGARRGRPLRRPDALALGLSADRPRSFARPHRARPTRWGGCTS